MKLRFVIDEEFDKKFVKDKKTLAYVDKEYRNSIGPLRAACALYQKSWDEINDDFSNYVERVTGYGWFYPEYECVISVIHRGISNWGSNIEGKPRIVRSAEDSTDHMRRMTAHELILSHYFEIYRRHYKDTGLTEGQVWALAEIAAYALTSLTPEVKAFWTDTEYHINHNYPQLGKLQIELKTVFIERKDFDEYIRKGIKLVEEYPDMDPDSKA